MDTPTSEYTVMSPQQRLRSREERRNEKNKREQARRSEFAALLRQLASLLKVARPSCPPPEKMLVLRKAIDEIDELRAENQLLKSELRKTMQAYRTLARVSEQGMSQAQAHFAQLRVTSPLAKNMSSPDERPLLSQSSLTDGFHSPSLAAATGTALSSGIEVPLDPTLHSEFSFQTPPPSQPSTAMTSALFDQPQSQPQPQPQQSAERGSRLQTPRFNNARRNLQARSLHFVRTGSGAHAQQMSVLDPSTQTCVPVVVGSAGPGTGVAADADAMRVHALVSGDEHAFSDTSVDSSRAASPERSPKFVESTSTSTRKRTRSRSISNGSDTHSDSVSVSVSVPIAQSHSAALSAAGAGVSVTTSSNGVAHMDIIKSDKATPSPVQPTVLIPSNAQVPVVHSAVPQLASPQRQNSASQLSPEADQSSSMPPADCKRRRTTSSTSVISAQSQSSSPNASPSFYPQDANGLLIGSLIAASRSLSSTGAPLRGSRSPDGAGGSSPPVTRAEVPKATLGFDSSAARVLLPVSEVSPSPCSELVPRGESAASSHAKTSRFPDGLQNAASPSSRFAWVQPPNSPPPP